MPSLSREVIADQTDRDRTAELCSRLAYKFERGLRTANSSN